MTKTVFLHPGHVTSRNDGDVHYIDSGQLARLYGVKRRDCVVVYQNRRVKGINNEAWRAGIHLYPKADGNYTHPGLEVAK